MDEMLLRIEKIGEDKYAVWNLSAADEEDRLAREASTTEERTKVHEAYKDKKSPMQGSEAEIRTWLRTLIQKENYDLIMPASAEKKIEEAFPHASLSIENSFLDQFSVFLCRRAECSMK